MTFLDFINNKVKTETANTKFNEAFKNEDVKHALDLIAKILNKKCKANISMISNPMETKIGSDICKSYLFIHHDGENILTTFTIDFLQGESSTNVYSISFVDNTIQSLFSDKLKANVVIYTNWASIAHIIPLVNHLLDTHDWKMSTKRSTELVNKLNNVQESKLYIGALEYRIYEATEAQNARWQVKAERDKAYNKRLSSPEAKSYWQDIEADYKEIVNAIKGGATTIDEIKLNVKHGVTLSILDKNVDELEQKLEQEHEDPEIVFDKMKNYVKMVIKGLAPSVILCGAPGVGKTYKVNQLLLDYGFTDYDDIAEDGYIPEKCFFNLKGKGSARRLYVDLYKFKDKGNIMIIDDVDALIGPKATEDAINILKAALDSTAKPEGRLVTYNISGPIFDDEGKELPKRFYYNGGVIVITNYQAGQLDTALRGRSYIQDIHFTTDDLLLIIERLLPELSPGVISMESKNKAFEYFTYLAKNKFPMTVSIRTFNTCAILFETANGDSTMDDEIVKAMIKEQMKLQNVSGGKKY